MYNQETILLFWILMVVGMIIAFISFYNWGKNRTLGSQVMIKVGLFPVFLGFFLSTYEPYKFCKSYGLGIFFA